MYPQNSISNTPSRKPMAVIEPAPQIYPESGSQSIGTRTENIRDNKISINISNHQFSIKQAATIIII